MFDLIRNKVFFKVVVLFYSFSVVYESSDCSMSPSDWLVSIFACLVSVYWHLLMVLTCIVLRANYIECFIHGLVTISMLFLGRLFSVQVFLIFIELFVFWLLNCRSYLHVMKIKPLSKYCIANIFYQYEAYLFFFLMIFWWADTLNFDESSVFIFVFYGYCFLYCI